MAGNPERDDEADAQQVVTAITGVRLAHADRYGGADYRSVDGSVALEVTTVTDRAAKAARGPLLELIGSRSSSADLNECWLVSVNERHAPLKGVSERVLPHLVVLSSAGLRYVRRQSAYGFRNDAASVRDAVAELIRQGVELAASPTGICPRTVHDHTVLWTAGGGGVASSSDAALSAVEKDLNARADNFDKLADTNAASTHLFVWVDSETSFAVTRAFLHRVEDAEPEFNLPTRAPQLSGPVTNLWIVHRGTRNGWRWDGSVWRAVSASTITATPSP